jgi:DNA-binding transcriptional ArsR family regulator
VPLDLRKRQQAEAMTFAVNYWVRVEILAVLHEGEFAAGQIAEMIDVSVKTITGHLHELYESGCIEIAGTKIVGGYPRTIYRAIVLPKVDHEVYRRMSVTDRRDLNGAVSQGILAETVSAYRRGKMDTDEELYLVWDAPTLDPVGEVEMHEHMEASFDGAKEIAARAMNRMAKSGEKGTTKVVGFLAFRRGRCGRPEGGYLNAEFSE